MAQEVPHSHENWDRFLPTLQLKETSAPSLSKKKKEQGSDKK